MFKKRTLKTSTASKRKDHIEDPADESEISSFVDERCLKKTKTDTKLIRNINSTIAESKPVLENNNTSVSETETQKPEPRVVVPKPAPKNVRVTTLIDFQPDVCKDFQQTGYCGYGDTCKFLHIRDESRQKKPIEKEWETVKTDSFKSQNLADKNVPFKCPICKSDYKSPVKTTCGHIFCQTCFMTRFKTQKKRKCFICKKDAGGAVQPVKDIKDVKTR